MASLDEELLLDSQTDAEEVAYIRQKLSEAGCPCPTTTTSTTSSTSSPPTMPKAAYSKARPTVRATSTSPWMPSQNTWNEPPPRNRQDLPPTSSPASPKPTSNLPNGRISRRSVTTNKPTLPMLRSWIEPVLFLGRKGHDMPCPPPKKRSTLRWRRMLAMGQLYFRLFAKSSVMAGSLNCACRFPDFLICSFAHLLICQSIYLSSASSANGR